VRSRHFQTGEPWSLAFGEGAGLRKAAASIESPGDALSFCLAAREKNEASRQWVACAMGPYGPESRVLAGWMGCPWTYGCLDEASASAPGQIAAAEWRGLYGADRINRETAL